MEILNMTFAGIPLGVFIVLLGVGYIAHNAWTEWQQNRANIKAIRKAREAFNAKHVWRSRIINDVDHGEWVRKDGRPIGVDD